MYNEPNPIVKADLLGLFHIETQLTEGRLRHDESGDGFLCCG